MLKSRIQAIIVVSTARRLCRPILRKGSETAKKFGICHPERSERSPQFAVCSTTYNQLPRSFASLRMTGGWFFHIFSAFPQGRAAEPHAPIKRELESPGPWAQVRVAAEPQLTPPFFAAMLGEPWLACAHLILQRPAAHRERLSEVGPASTLLSLQRWKMRRGEEPEGL